MNGRLLISRKVGIAATLSLLGGIATVACSSGGVDFQESEGNSEVPLETPVGRFSATPNKSALQVVAELATRHSLLGERVLPSPEVLLRQHGDRLLPKLKDGSPGATLQVNLGANAQGRLLVNPAENPEQAIALTPHRTRDVTGTIQVDGRVIYQNAYTNTDVVLTANHNRLAYTLVLQSAESPADFSWQLDVPLGLRQVASSKNETSLVDAKGHLRLTLREVTITGADGKVQTTPVALGPDGTASVHIDPLSLAYPAVVQFEIDAPPIALAIIPPEIIKARMMVLLDTSGSMAWRFDSQTNAGEDMQGGDGDTTSVFCDNSIGTAFRCNADVACTIANGGINLHGVTPDDDPPNVGIITQPSRMLAAKSALSNVVNANSGLIDFGLTRYRENASCENTTYCSTPQVGSFLWGRRFNNPIMNVYRELELDNIVDGCQFGTTCDSGTCIANADGNGRSACSCSNNNDQCDGSTVQGYTIGDGDNDCDGGGNTYCRVDGLDLNTTFSGTACSASSGGNCTACAGNNAGRVLVQPSTTSSGQVRRWVDFVEDFCSSTAAAGGAPRNPELRTNGYTPLAGSIDTVRTDWYQPAYNAWDTNDTGHALYDEKLDCRPYVLVVLTDGDDQCGGNPSNEVEELRAVGGGGNPNPITIYTMGMGNAAGLDTGELNQMAVAGGSGATTAPIAENQEDIEAAFADIVAETVKFEICNGLDDNCNERIDEGLNVYQECAVNGDCGSSDCDAGRCGCTEDDQCASGYTCAEDSFCRPACSVGVSVCRNEGVRKCGATGGQCCVDDGEATCTELEPNPPGAEICNRIDDDCDGLIDEDFPSGCPQCIPRPEICNGEDDDCDGEVDNDDDDLVGVGVPCGTDEGACTAGTITCVDGEPVCENEGEPQDEVCNGIDDDCDGQTDGLTQPCYTGPDGTEDVGVCHGGTQACTAPVGTPGEECTGDDCWGECVGDVTPTPEICDGLDNDCDGDTDEGVPAVVQACEDDSDCLGSNNCVSNACRCSAGSCADGYVCGGGNTCYDEDTVTGDDCCDPNFGDLCGKGACQFGTWTCSGNQVSCVGSTGPSDEICDGLDNDCDEQTDEDLPGVGSPCQTDNGVCGGTLECIVQLDDDGNPEGGAIVCVPNSGGTPEICNLLDDDCDGLIDEAPDIYDNDETGNLTEEGVECNVPEQTEGDCEAGVYRCINGEIICQGAVQPGTEVCDGVDNDCDGDIDEGTCSPDGRCIDGECRFRCGGGEFPCDPGFICDDGFCIPIEGTSAGNGNGSDNTGSGGSNGSGGTASGGSNGNGANSTATGGTANGGTSGASGDSTNNANNNNDSTVTTGLGTDGGDNSDDIYGLASGGGGCACHIAERRTPNEFGLLMGLVLAAGVVRRRRSSGKMVL